VGVEKRTGRAGSAQAEGLTQERAAAAAVAAAAARVPHRALHPLRACVRSILQPSIGPQTLLMHEQQAYACPAPPPTAYVHHCRPGFRTLGVQGSRVRRCGDGAAKDWAAAQGSRVLEGGGKGDR